MIIGIRKLQFICRQTFAQKQEKPYQEAALNIRSLIEFATCNENHYENKTICYIIHS